MFRRLLLGVVLGVGLAGCYYYAGSYDVYSTLLSRLCAVFLLLRPALLLWPALLRWLSLLLLGRACAPSLRRWISRRSPLISG
jgi:hypothetical protein